MSWVVLNPAIVRISGKLPLQSVPVISFLVPITAAVGLVGYFWFQNGQQAVNQLASQSIDAQVEPIYLQYEVLAFAVREKLI